MMRRILLNVVLTIFVLAWLAYISPLGFYFCLGLMTHEGPTFLKPIFQTQFIAAMLSLLAVPVCAFVLWMEKRTKIGALLGVMASLVVPSIFFWRPDPWPLRKQGLTQAAMRMDAINTALADFHAQTGGYPATSQELGVDNRTGMAAYPYVTYRQATPTSPFSDYQLQVSTNIGVFGFDSFFFWPSQKYPKSIYGGEVELIATSGGIWAYVHE